MRSKQEIVAKIKEKGSEFMSFWPEVLAVYLTFDEAKPILKPDAKPDGWPAPHELSRDAVVSEMRGYMDFAWEKAFGERGLSASRSVDKMAAWLWLLGDDEMLAFAENDGKYPQYGKPILAKICEKYGFDIQVSE